MSAAADAVVTVHLLWILFLIFGAFIGRRIRWVKWTHLGALLFSVLLQLFQWTCPLTDLEARLRGRPLGGSDAGFIAQYAERLVYLAVPPELVFLATLVIIAASAWAYSNDVAQRHRFR